MLKNLISLIIFNIALRTIPFFVLSYY